ncbi:MAG: hypothetical protein Q8N79_07265 [Candidatus Methanoperedens sp.]|nr:hypothetical protein [Candidatus Methanoperedens sp.]
MIQILFDIALRLGLGLIIGVVLIIFITIVETAFYAHNKQIHIIVIAVLISLIIYALGDIAIDILRI